MKFAITGSPLLDIGHRSFLQLMALEGISKSAYWSNGSHSDLFKIPLTNAIPLLRFLLLCVN